MILIPNISLAGYRSFGDTIQRFEKFSKLNLFIGPNNCGKSNVLRFIHDVYPKLPQRDSLRLGPLDRHFPNAAEFRCGFAISLALDAEEKAYKDFNEFVFPLVRQQQGFAGTALQLFQKKAQRDKTADAWFDFVHGRDLESTDWDAALAELGDSGLHGLWHALTGRTGGSRKQHWHPETLRSLTPNWSAPPVALIPAIRRIGEAGSESTEYGGAGLVDRLAKLQNPDVHAQADKERFNRINQFLKSVTDNASATIEVPYARDTLIVHIDGRALPLESLGTGIHEVVILASAATLLQNSVVCMEEPELHLNPILQKKLVRYLMSATSNQYFVTTHSAALMDTPGAEIYHLRLSGGQSRVERVTSDRQRSEVCEDLGYHPSDLLQANCVIWVEGPSDRLYINWWIRKRAPELQEGVHYSIMFYGGRLAAHLTGNDLDQAVENFISLRRLNRRSTIVLDSDRTASDDDLNATKNRLVGEFETGPGHAWVTDGREIENYVQPTQIAEAIQAVAPNAIARQRYKQYDKVLELGGSEKARQAPKVEVAKYITTTYEPDESRFELSRRLDSLVTFIRDSNPHYLHVAG